MKHGMRYSKEYAAWNGMIGRCHSRTHKDFQRYGARGIIVYGEWRKDFMAFFLHVGAAPSHIHQLDRINTNGNYEPNNVRWVLPIVQAQNRRTSKIWVINNIEFPSAQAAANRFEVTDMTIHKWAKGYFDKRRGTFAKPKEGCYENLRYGTR